MIGTVLVVFLQLSGAQVPSGTTATTPAQDTMSCQYDRATRVRSCTAADGQLLHCRRERQIGSRFANWVCLTEAEEQRLEGESRDAIDRQQRITTPPLGVGG